MAAWADALAPGAVESDRVTSDAAVSDTVEGDAVVYRTRWQGGMGPNVVVQLLETAPSASGGFSRRRAS
ncbi:MAG: hypothetical protein DIU79_11810 [Actinobacteria bacterium]|nr:MAG: hypothetical protein DIU79_11810 [Actinomycetota bacterium]